MGLAFRVDVDNPFGRSNKIMRLLNLLSHNYGIVPRMESIGFLRDANMLKDFFHDHKVPVTWFFRNATLPSKKSIGRFRLYRGEVNLHAENTFNLSSFTNEVRKWEARAGLKVTGFTKHGSGELKLSRMHDPRYDPESLVDFGKTLGLKYFIGNSTDLTQMFVDYDGFTYIPSIYWLDRIELHKDYPIEDLIRDADEINAVVLIHPIWFKLRKDLREQLRILVESVSFEPLSSVISKGVKDGA